MAGASAGVASGTGASTGDMGFQPPPGCNNPQNMLPCPRGATCATNCVCPTGETACAEMDPQAAGACVNEQTDPFNCGQCGVTCPASAPICQNGSCVCVTMCGGSCVNARIDSDNCGGCGVACPPATVCVNGVCGQPPSCAPGGPGMTNCSPGDGGTESCCTSLEVEGGTYYRAYDLAADGGGALAGDGGVATEANPATVSTFRLDKYEVTVGRFRQFSDVSINTEALGWVPPPGSGKHTHLNGGRGLVDVGGIAYETGWVANDVRFTSSYVTTCGPHVTWTYVAGANENLPINCVSWYAAYAFCIWDGGFLPSEAEWEYAAAGGAEQREYVWGSADPGTASQYAIYGCYYNGNGNGVCPSSPAAVAQVGAATLGVGLWGQLDLAGSVSEWSLDRFAPYSDSCADCANLAVDLEAAVPRVVRGGAFELSAAFLVPAFRAGGPTLTMPATGPDSLVDDFTGFRCARIP